MKGVHVLWNYRGTEILLKQKQNRSILKIFSLLFGNTYFKEHLSMTS